MHKQHGTVGPKHRPQKKITLFWASSRLTWLEARFTLFFEVLSHSNTKHATVTGQSKVIFGASTTKTSGIQQYKKVSKQILWDYLQEKRKIAVM